MDRTRAVCDLLFHGCLAYIFLLSYLEETSPWMDSRYEKHGFTGHKTFGGKYKFATFLNLIVQIIYFSLSTLNAFVEFLSLLLSKLQSLDRIQAKNQLRHASSFFFRGVAFSAAAFVVSQFWILYAIDRNTVYSEKLEQVIARGHNHILHTLPLVAVLLDAYFFQHVYHESTFLAGAWPTITYSFAYLIWVLITRYNCCWAYPFLGDLGDLERVVFFAVLIGYNVGLYQIGKMLSRKFWNSRLLTVIK